jgi:hypothetical protein
LITPYQNVEIIVMEEKTIEMKAQGARCFFDPAGVTLVGLYYFLSKILSRLPWRIIPKWPAFQVCAPTNAPLAMDGHSRVPSLDIHHSYSVVPTHSDLIN